MSISFDEEKAIIVALERCAEEEGEMGEKLSSSMTFRFLLQTLHDEETVSEEAILSWAEDRREEVDTVRGKLFHSQPVQDFIEWLQEESDDEDESGSEEESGDEE